MQAKALVTALAAVLATMCSSSWAQGPEAVIALNLDFYPLVPCRAVDTRTGTPLSSGSRRTFQLAGLCGVPATARALAINVTVVGPTASGYLKLWPADLSEPFASTITFGPEMLRANNAIMAVAVDGLPALSAVAYLADSGSVHLIIDVTGYLEGDPVNQCQCLIDGLPLLIFSVSPSGGNIGQTVVISGQSFAPSVRVRFGDAMTGSSAPIVSSSPTSITTRMPTPPPDFRFSTEVCDGNGDGIPGGTRNVPTPMNVNVRNLDGTGCVTTLSNAFTLTPTNSICTGDHTTPPQVSDVVNDDFEGVIDHSSVSPADAVGSVTGDPVAECQCPTNDLPLPVISGVDPSGGSVSSQVTISGQNFAPHVQVQFGDATTGSSASIVSSSSTSITARVPPPPPGFTFSTEPCDANGDGIPSGQRNVPTPITLNVRNLDGTGCVTTLSNGFMLNPTNTACYGDDGVPPLASPVPPRIEIRG